MQRPAPCTSSPISVPRKEGLLLAGKAQGQEGLGVLAGLHLCRLGSRAGSGVILKVYQPVVRYLLLGPMTSKIPHCSSFLSVTVIKHPNQKQLEEERVIWLRHPGQSPAPWESQGRKLEAGTMEGAACQLAHSWAYAQLAFLYSPGP